MWRKILALFMSVAAFMSSLFGGGSGRVSEYKEFLDLSYGEDSLQTYDLYLPTDKGETLGLILYIHGGAWTSGDKASYRSAARSTAESHGYAAATINYRFLSAKVSMRAILSDVHAAVSAIYDTAQAEGYTLNKMLTTGISAGAHLALMYAYNTPEDAKIQPVAVCSQCGPTDLGDPNFYAEGMALQNNTYIQMLVGAVGQETASELIARYTAQYSPVTYADTAVPTLIAHGQKDTVVPYSNAETLDAALTENGVTHMLIPYPNSGHALENDPDCAMRYSKMFFAFAAVYLR